MSLTELDRRRRRAAKLFNERLKLGTAVLNAGCIGVLGAAVIIPGVTSPQSLSSITLAWLLVALVLHLMAQGVMSFYKSED